jgi:hypothetical protein
MPDTRPAHMRVSLLNMPTPKYEGAAHSLYGPRGPQQAHNTGRRRASEPPMSLEHHVQDAIAKIPDLSPRQKLALRNTLMAMCRDISFIKLVHEQAHQLGPYSDQAAGVPMDQGRPL